MFADKAILIEGTAERILLPKFIEKNDIGKPPGSCLASQYVSVLEVGGAYAHLFFGLLDFLEVQTLVITDIDSIDANNDGKRCKVSTGTGTSNACIKQWFTPPVEAPDGVAPPPLALADLISKADEDKVSGILRIAYQVPESQGRPCGRTFEDAFMLANLASYGLDGDDTDAEEGAWIQVAQLKKSQFALGLALGEANWVVPRYISEG